MSGKQPAWIVYASRRRDAMTACVGQWRMDDARTKVSGALQFMVEIRGYPGEGEGYVAKSGGSASRKHNRRCEVR